MKTFGIIAAGLFTSIAAMANTIDSPGSILVGVPQNFQSTTGTSSTPFWNNNSVDGQNMNAGDYLTGSNPVMGATNYLGTGSNFGSYLSTGAPGLDAPNFTFSQSGFLVQATLLYSNGQSNYPYNSMGMVGNQIGLYDVADPTVNETLFATGTLWGSPNGIINNNVTPQTPVIVGSWSNYGIYSYTCGYDASGAPYCHMYYSNSAINWGDPNHQHFSLFENPETPNTYYIGFEENFGLSATEGNGDYNDVIFKLETTQNQTFNTTDEIAPTVTPEPATWSILGLGLAGLVVIRRFKSSRFR
jgi:hypothetical protein